MDGGPVFLSAVTREFGTARDGLANSLHGAHREVMVRREFPQRPGALTLPRKSRDHIRECGAVICLIGGRDGHYPEAIEAAAFPGIPKPLRELRAFVVKKPCPSTRADLSVTLPHVHSALLHHRTVIFKPRRHEGHEVGSLGCRPAFAPCDRLRERASDTRPGASGKDL